MDPKYLYLLAGWLVYFSLHSLLASRTVKAWVVAKYPRYMPAYRLGFNVIALVALLVPLGMLAALRSEPLWQWEGIGRWVTDGLALMAVAGFLWSLRYYKGGEFVGISQWRRQEQSVDDQEGFYLSPLHRFVRHPWYFLALVILWTRPMDMALLLTALVITAYFIIGSRLEELKLLHYHGDAYRVYRSCVPGLFPLPWRFISASAARQLTAKTCVGTEKDEP